MTLARLAEDALETYGEYVALAFEGRRYTNLDQQRAASASVPAIASWSCSPTAPR